MLNWVLSLHLAYVQNFIKNFQFNNKVKYNALKCRTLLAKNLEGGCIFAINS